MVTPEHHVALVDHLVQYSQPVRRIWPVRVRWALFLTYLLAVGALVAWTWPRPDLPAKLHQAFFILGLVALIVATGYSAFLALRSAVPGRTPSRFDAALALALVGTAALSLYDPTNASPARVAGWMCALRTLAIAALPWIILLVAIRRGAPVRVESAAIFAGAAALLFATTTLRVACPDDGSVHWLTWHLGTAALATALTTPLATTWLQAWRHG